MKDQIKILFLADEPDKGLWDYFEKEKLAGIDIIISCGDLPPQYLSFLATYFKGPVLYVHGNHDECYEKTPPGGCTSIDGKVFVYEGVKIAGLGGSMEYKRGEHLFTERSMKKRVNKLKKKLFFKHGLDIFVTHSPAFNLCDGDELPHRGFKSFYKILDKYHPQVFAHGHVHLNYSYNQPRIVNYGDTTVINAYQKYIWTYEKK